MEEKKSFVLYEYLRYFWDKKVYFLIIPLVMAILFAGAVKLVRDIPAYTGTSTVYVGSLTEKYLTNPENIKAEYDGFGDQAEVFVSEKGIVKFVLRGDSKETVEKNLTEFTEKFMADLQKQYDIRIKVSNDKLAYYEKHAEKLEKELELYKSKLANSSLSVTESSDLTELIIDTEQRVSDEQKDVQRMKGDLVFFEKPNTLTLEVHETKTYMAEAAVVGLILGLVFATLLLILMKYMAEARRYYNK